MIWMYEGWPSEEEVIKEAERSGWEIVPPDKVEVTYKLKGGT